MIGDHKKLIKDTQLELNKIREWINKNQFDSNTQYLIKYTIVKISGMTEVVYKEMVFQHLTNNANEEAVKYFATKVLVNSSNPNTGNIEALLETINNKWKENFSKAVKENGVKADLNQLVQMRNDFAHGKNINVTIDIVIRYFKSAETVLMILDDVINNNGKKYKKE